MPDNELLPAEMVNLLGVEESDSVLHLHCLLRNWVSPSVCRWGGLYTILLDLTCLLTIKQIKDEEAW